MFFVLLKELSSLGGPWTFREGLQIFLFHLSKNRRIVQIEFFPVQEFYREFRRATSFDKSFRFPRRVLQVLPAKVLLSIFGSLQFKVIRNEKLRTFENEPGDTLTNHSSASSDIINYFFQDSTVHFWKSR